MQKNVDSITAKLAFTVWSDEILSYYHKGLFDLCQFADLLGGANLVSVEQEFMIFALLLSHWINAIV